MNIKLNELLAFTVGAIVGTAVTYKVVKNRYEQIIEAMEARYENRELCEEEQEDDDEIITVPETNAIDDMRMTYNNLVQNAGYVEKEDTYVPGPYTISPEEFDTLDGYRTESLNHYACGTITDQFDNVIDDPESIIGDIDPAAYYGQYEDDAVYVRNDVTKCDYEILRDTRKYSDAYPEE